VYYELSDSKLSFFVKCRAILQRLSSREMIALVPSSLCELANFTATCARRFVPNQVCCSMINVDFFIVVVE
jgi:hypothetical protein